ncbi:MAG TPA: hypothetical protein VG407_02250 [Caulobacteraceae bacterium]|jgi:hypothetical protein|nr:hypothetical protein [Caulobacteraceae bacterium]
MTVRSLFLPVAAAAALSVCAVAFSVPPAIAQTDTWQPYSWLTERCRDDACATYRCNDSGCTRIAPWRYGGADAGYFTDRSYDGYHAENTTRFDRCFGQRCATFRCDGNGDRCTRVGAWRYR